jgi:excinuclease ABC subunit B
VHGKVIMYADRETDSMKKAIGETRRRREAQIAYNEKHGITPKTIEKAVQALEGTAQDDFVDVTKPAKKAKQVDIPLEELPSIISALKKEMFDLSESLEFEKAAVVRDRLRDLEDLQISLGSR